MEPKYTYSESTVMPNTLEISGTNVYMRKDIKEVMRRDMDDNEVKYFTYQEAVMTSEEFNQYANNVSMVNAINGIHNAENIVQILKEQNSGGINQITIMEAMADLFDAVASLAE